MQVLIITLSALIGVVAGALTVANIYVVVETARHRRREAMRFLAHFSRAVMMLRLSDSISPSKPYRNR
jgi:hypothetical protein